MKIFYFPCYLKEIIINGPLFLIVGRYIVLQNDIKLEGRLDNLYSRKRIKTLDKGSHFYHLKFVYAIRFFIIDAKKVIKNIKKKVEKQNSIA